MKIFASLSFIILSISLLVACGNQNGKSIDDFKSTGADVQNIDALFSSKCGMCHGINEDKIGPALSGALQRWDNDPKRLKAFIKNSNEVIQSGDPYAQSLYQKWNRSAMPSFPNLSEDELNQLIEYIK